MEKKQTVSNIRNWVRKKEMHGVRKKERKWKFLHINEPECVRKLESIFFRSSACVYCWFYSRLENRSGNVQLEDSISLLLASLLQKNTAQIAPTAHTSLSEIQAAFIYTLHIVCVCVCVFDPYSILKLVVYDYMLGSTFEPLSNICLSLSLWLFNPIPTNSAFLHFSSIRTSGKMSVRGGGRELDEK